MRRTPSFRTISRAQAERIARGALRPLPLARCDSFSYRPAGARGGHATLSSLQGHRRGKCLFHALSNRHL